MDLRAARAAFFAECCVPDAHLAAAYEASKFSGLVCIHLRTRGDDNVMVAGERPILKHLFLQNSRFKGEVVNFYRQRGFAWVDIVPLNRNDWKIFLTPATHGSAQRAPPPVNQQQQQYQQQQQQQHHFQLHAHQNQQNQQNQNHQNHQSQGQNQDQGNLPIGTGRLLDIDIEAGL